jgi:putative membrane-bound dehydrogenase-like protein
MEQLLDSDYRRRVLDVRFEFRFSNCCHTTCRTPGDSAGQAKTGVWPGTRISYDELSMRVFVAILWGLTVQVADPAGSGELGLRVPAGFHASLFADHTIANDIYSLTIDPHGRVVVAGRGYIRVLHDRDGDGRADGSTEFSDRPKDGAMGLLWEGDTLWVTGDGGLARFRDRDGDSRADGPPEVICRLKTGGEHAAHAIRRGPDGGLYVLCGNNAGIDRTYANLPTSPIKEPVAGCILRFPPDLNGCEIFAHGFRNPYDMDFNQEGDLFTFDSDNERCVSLPWYEPTRLYHVQPGGHHGWLSPQHAETFRLPPYFFDVVAPVLTFGRGSPTGVVCCRHEQFPAKYHGGMILLDWTFGRVYFVSLKRIGRRYQGHCELFLESIGDNGFAPTDVEAHPRTGELYISVGGRGTRGAVYRVRYTGPLSPVETPTSACERDPLSIRLPESSSSDLPFRIAYEYGPDALNAAVQSWRSATSPAEMLIALRGIQLSAGDLVDPRLRGTVFEGYSRRRAQPSLEPAVAALAQRFPIGHPAVDRENARVLAAAQADGTQLFDKIIGMITANSSPVEDIHYLIVLARLRGPLSESLTTRIANALLGLDEKIAARELRQDSNWPLRLRELHEALSSKDPNLNAAMLSHASFGRPGHLLFTRAESFDRRRAAEIFWTRLSSDTEYPWSSPLVELLSWLPAHRAFPLLRTKWEDLSLRDAVVAALSSRPDPEDRERFFEALDAPQYATIGRAVDALEKLPPSTSPAKLAKLIRTLERLGESETEALRDRIVRYLGRATGQRQLGSSAQAWTSWFVRQYPEEGGILVRNDAIDWTGWQARLAQVPWTLGDAGRGRNVFSKASCGQCHSGASAVGPDLRGVTGRFSREDLFAAIVDPSRNVSERYQTSVVATRSGAVYEGIVIYEAVDGIILQAGIDATVRVRSADIVTVRKSLTSLMPAGLLDKLDDREIADLFAYLKAVK